MFCAVFFFFVSLKNVSIEYLQVLDFFNTRMDAQRVDGDWSVNEVLQVIIVNCRSWRGDGMKVIWKKYCDLWCASIMEYIIKNLRGLLVLLLCGYFFWQMFTQLRFMYEQERHPEEFFIPYVWQLVLSHWYGSLSFLFT